MASDPSSIVDPFHKAIYGQIAADIDKRMVNLCAGSAVDYGEYQRQVGYLEAMNNVLTVCEEIEKDRHGAKPGQE